MNAGATRTIGVPLLPAAIAFLRSHGPTALDVIADTNPMYGPLPARFGQADGGSPGMT